MVRSLPNRLPRVLALAAATTFLSAAPALATEGPAAPPPGAQLPTGLSPAGFTPFLTPPSLTPQSAGRLIRRARLVHKRVRKGRHGRLRISLVSPSKLRIVMHRRGGGARVVVNVPARGRTVAVRLPSKAKGRTLRPGRYAIRIVATDATGAKSAPTRLTMIVRRPAHR
jgi:hypothetical protein